MRSPLVLVFSAAFLFTVPTGVSPAQTVSQPSNELAAKKGKSEKACYTCCRNNQIKMGLPEDQIELCVQRCMIGTARNC
jgi:hypothetical protein